MKKCFLILSLFTVVACKRAEAEPSGLGLYFENPQPINDSELSNIPNKFQGYYVSLDSAYLNVQEKNILKEFYNRFRFHKKDLDSIKKEFDEVGNKYVLKRNKDVYEVKCFNDSIEFSNKQIDTLFTFSNTQKAKRFNGQLVLNYKDSIYWTIKSVRLEKNTIKIKYLYSEEDLKRMDSVTKVKSTMIDSFSFIMKPSRNELKQILNLKRLGQDWEFKKTQKLK